MRKLKLPADVLFHHDLHLMVFRPHGILKEKSIEEIVAFLDKAEERAETPFNRFSDLSKIEAIEVDFEYICRVSLYRRTSYFKYPPVKSAFYVTTEEVEEAVTAHAVITDQSPLQVAVFEDVPAAARWLDVSVENLRIEDDRAR
jgi:hypothetical protein